MRLTTVSSKRLVFTPARAGDGASGGVERLANCVLAFGAAQNLGAAQRIDVGYSGAGIAQLRSARIRCPREYVPGANAVELKRNDLAVEHGHQPAHRADENFRCGLRQYMFLGQ